MPELIQPVPEWAVYYVVGFWRCVPHHQVSTVAAIQGGTFRADGPGGRLAWVPLAAWSYTSN